jgi:hypothetical protein
MNDYERKRRLVISKATGKKGELGGTGKGRGAEINSSDGLSFSVVRPQTREALVRLREVRDNQ